MSVSWSNPVDADDDARRAGGRRRYNAGRKFLRRLLWVQIFCRLASTGVLRRARLPCGVRDLLALEFQVSVTTVSRDFRALRASGCRLPVLGEWPQHLANGA
jgi:hypothetical protein